MVHPPIALERLRYRPETGQVIEKILRHLKLWDRPERPPPSTAGRSIHYDKQNVDFDETGRWPDATA